MFLYNVERGRPNAWGISLIMFIFATFLLLSYELFLAYRQGSFREAYYIRYANATEVWEYASEFVHTIEADNSFLEYELTSKMDTEVLREYRVRYAKWISNSVPVTLFGECDFFIYRDTKHFIRSINKICAESIFTCMEYTSAINITDVSDAKNPNLVEYSEEVIYRVPILYRSYTRGYLRNNHNIFRRHIIKKMSGTSPPPVKEKQPEQSAKPPNKTQPGIDIRRIEL